MASACEQSLPVCLPCVQEAGLATWQVKPGPQSKAARFQSLIAKHPKEFVGSQFTLAVPSETTAEEVVAALQDQLPEVPWLRTMRGRVSCQAAEGVVSFSIEHLDSPWPPKLELEPGTPDPPELPPYYCVDCLWDCRVLQEFNIGVSESGPGGICKLCRLERGDDWYMTTFKEVRSEVPPENKSAGLAFAALKANESMLITLLSQRFCVSRQKPQETMLKLLSQFLEEGGLRFDGFRVKFDFTKTGEHALDIVLGLIP